ncbi:unnamed protein product [Larinioides sclopetarius]|uniref:Uncharacterized protein n=1 Tax=Larinioides sclopetarius TaxID=280406 RepID=A0AAV2BUH7_9ARAC
MFLATCCWDRKIKKMVPSSAEPYEDWLKLPVKVMYSAGSYEKIKKSGRYV